MRYSFLFLLLLPLLAQTQPATTEVAVYYFPGFHASPVTDQWHGKGWSEWDLTQTARPRFPGHEQPKVPTWGYFDESDPTWSAKEIDLAAQHGVTTFLFDWYWYEKTGLFLHEALENGFLKAPNNTKLKFALMWANHHWLNLQPTPYTNDPAKLLDGEVSPETFERMTDYIITTYFKRPNYLTVGGKPYFSIFDAARFINGFGSVEKAAEALARFEEKVRKAGFPGLHLNLIDQNVWDRALTRTLGKPTRETDVLGTLRPASITSYNLLAAYKMASAPFPKAVYADAIRDNVRYWTKAADTTYKALNIPYFSTVSMGWDVSPRLVATDRLDTNKGYPWMPVISGDNTPAAFEGWLRQSKAFMDAHPNQPRILTLNAWNEWTEGNYLLPEKRTGLGYLQAIRKVFPPQVGKR
jgi:hypothetical protein